MSVIEFITWETAFGIFVAGVIVGWFLSVVTARLFIKRYQEFIASIEKDAHRHHD